MFFFLKNLPIALKKSPGRSQFNKKISQKHWKSYQCIQKKSQFGVVYGLVASLNRIIIGEHYRDMIFNFFLPKMQELDLHDMWFQQDGATCHIARVTMSLLRGEFGEHFISR